MGSSARRAARISQINLKQGILEESDFAPQTFDAITLFHVFEHLTEPRRMLRTISTILKQEGLLIMSLPNIASWQSRLFKGKWLHLDPPRHLCFFAPADLINILKEHGLELVRQRYFSVEQNPYGMVQSILNILCSKREVLFERLKGNKQYAGEYSPLNIFLQKIFLLFTFPVFILTDLIASSIKKGATMEFTFKKSGISRKPDTSHWSFVVMERSNQQ
jgi:predicted SAM-dependent methyltransferase